MGNPLPLLLCGLDADLDGYQLLLQRLLHDRLPDDGQHRAAGEARQPLRRRSDDGRIRKTAVLGTDDEQVGAARPGGRFRPSGYFVS